MRCALFWNLRSVEWQFLTDFSGQPILSIFKAWTFKYETNGSSRKAGKKLPYTARKIQKIAVPEGH